MRPGDPRKPQRRRLGPAWRLLIGSYGVVGAFGVQVALDADNVLAQGFRSVLANPQAPLLEGPSLGPLMLAVSGPTGLAVSPLTLAATDQSPEPFQMAQAPVQPLPPEAPVAPVRQFTITMPIKDGPVTLGDLDVLVAADGQVQVPVRKFIEIVEPVLSAGRRSDLENGVGNQEYASPEEITAAGVPVEYDEGLVQLTLKAPVEDRAVVDISVIPRIPDSLGRPVPRAPFSAYVNYNIRADLEHVGDQKGFQSPSATFIANVNIFGLAIENDIRYAVENNQTPWQRFSTKAVYDIIPWGVRVAAGDLFPRTRQFQGFQDILGLSISRYYDELEPTRVIRSGGSETFRLDSAAEVEVLLNGQVYNRFNLGPGNYNVRDFPFANGSNNVQIIATDSSGRREVLNANVFSDFTLLDPGLFEFDFAGGIASSLDRGERVYDQDRWFANGFVRTGVFSFLTLGASFQADQRGRLWGAEAVIASPIGTIGLNGAMSEIDAFETGYAGRIRLEQRFDDFSIPFSIQFDATYRSTAFANLNDTLPNNPIAWDLSVNANIDVSDAVSISLAGTHSIGRDANPDQTGASVGVSWSPTDELAFTASGNYRDDGSEASYAVFVGATMRFGERSYVQATYNSDRQVARIAAQYSSGSGIDNWGASGAFEYSEDSTSFNGSVGYRSNRGFAALEHVTAYDLNTSEISVSRTSVRVEGSIAFAGGSLALGDRIQNSFAIVRQHPTLGDRDIYVDLNDQTGEYSSKTDFAGPAVVSDMSANVPRLIRVSVPDAPVGYDLGDSNFPVVPTYGSGYELTVGSDFTVTAIVDLRDTDGTPFAFVSGTAELAVMGDVESADPSETRKITVFTNGKGRLAANGLKAGRWIITINTTPQATFILDVPDGTVGLYRAGTLKAQP